MWTIAKISFKEILYKRIFLIAFLMTLAYLLLYGVATHFAAAAYLEDLENLQQDAQKMMLIRQHVIGSQLLSTGLYFSNFIVGLLSILASVGSIAGTIENHQIEPVVTRPIRRLDIVMGKYIGLGCLMAVYSLSLFASILLINQLLAGPFQVELDLVSIGKAGLIFACLPMVITAPAVLLSTRLSTLNSGIILIVLYGMSFIGGFVEQLGNIIDKTSLINIGILTSLIFPTDAMYRSMTNFLFQSQSDLSSMTGNGLFLGSNPPSGFMLLYYAFYVIVILWAAVLSFSRRDI